MTLGTLTPATEGGKLNVISPPPVVGFVLVALNVPLICTVVSNVLPLGISKFVVNLY